MVFAAIDLWQLKKIVEGSLKNKLKEARTNQLLSKAELARRAGISVLTVDRIERGYDARPATKRALLKALGYTVAEKNKVFPAN